MAALFELQEAFRQRAYEKEITPLNLDGRYELYKGKGVPLEYLFVRPVDAEKPYDPAIAFLLAGVTAQLDIVANEQLERLTSPEIDIFSVYKDTEELGQIQEKFIDGLVSLDKHIDNKDRLQYLIPKMGAIPLMEAALQKGLDPGRVHPIDIYGGTVVDVTGGAKLTGEMPDPLLDENNIVAFIDDVGDSWNTSILFARKRRASRLGMDWAQMETEDMYRSLAVNIRDLWDKKNEIAKLREEAKDVILKQDEENIIDHELTQRYSEAASLFQKEGVVVGFLFSKNRFADNALQGKINEVEQRGANASLKEKEWVVLQKHMAGVTASADKERWITGGEGVLPFRMFDIAIEGKDILKHISNERVRVLLEAGHVDNLLFRTFAGLKKLVQFNSSKTEDVMQLVAAWVEASLERYLNHQERDPQTSSG